MLLIQVRKQMLSYFVYFRETNNGRNNHPCIIHLIHKKHNE